VLLGAPLRRDYDAEVMITDTEEAARQVQLKVTRRLTASERVRLAVEMSEAARRIAIDGERRRHPELTEEQARHVVFRRMWGAALAQRVPVVASRRE
jgi:hypothetical protein